MRKTILMLLAVGLLGTSFIGCRETNTVEDEVEDVVDDAEDAVD